MEGSRRNKRRRQPEHVRANAAAWHCRAEQPSRGTEALGNNSKSGISPPGKQLLPPAPPAPAAGHSRGEPSPASPGPSSAAPRAASPGAQAALGRTDRPFPRNGSSGGWEPQRPTAALSSRVRSPRPCYPSTNAPTRVRLPFTRHTHHLQPAVPLHHLNAGGTFSPP